MERSRTLSESDFVVEYTDLYCTWYLECADPAQLVFDGTATLEDCTGLFGPGVADQASTCKLDKGAAKDCLDAMVTVACPAEEDAVLDDSLPPECATTWKKCLGEGNDTGVEP